MFDQEKFDDFAVSNNSFVFGEVTLTSGRKSYFYDRWREITGDAYLLIKTVEFVIDKVESMGLEWDSFYGVPEGATTLGTTAQLISALSTHNLEKGKYVVPTGRKEPKVYGLGDPNFVVKPEGRTIVLENILTTGGSALRELEKLSDVEVVGLITLVDRMQVNNEGKSMTELFEERGIKYGYLSDALTLLPRLYQKLQPGEDLGRKIEEEFRRYGVRDINLY
jgi:orotate phosphoribosyltransferase